jgi:hypothetical protein
MYVDGEELIRAYKQVDVEAMAADTWVAPGRDGAAGALADTSTGTALEGAQQAVQQTITTVGGRYKEIAGALVNASRALLMVDERAATLLASIGDLNHSPTA